MTQVVMPWVGKILDSSGTGASVNAEAMKIFLKVLLPKLPKGSAGSKRCLNTIGWARSFWVCLLSLIHLCCHKISPSCLSRFFLISLFNSPSPSVSLTPVLFLPLGRHLNGFLELS